MFKEVLLLIYSVSSMTGQYHSHKRDQKGEEVHLDAVRPREYLITANALKQNKIVCDRILMEQIHYKSYSTAV